jgi:two-component system response regulator
LDKELPIDVHVFIVDDDRDDHFFIKRALKTIIPQASVTSVYDGTEAIEYLFNQDNFKNGQKYPDVILLDINMPRMNGKMACKLIRNDKKFDAIPIIILTTSSHPADKEQLLQLGANDYFIKPNDINIFAEILDTIKKKWMIKV